MGIFKNVTKILKKAAPIIGGAIGFGMGGGAFGAALGSGIGSLIGGGDTEDALKAAALGGIAGYAGGKFFGPSATSKSSFLSGPELMTTSASTAPVSAIKDAGASGILSKLIPESTLGKVALAGGLGTLALGGLDKEEEKSTMRPYPEGRTRLGYGRIDDKFYNLDNEEERKQYFEDLRNRRKDKDDDEVVTMSSGGLNLIGETIGRGLHGEIKDRTEQIQPFLDQVSNMAQQKFGVDIKTDSGLGGMQGINQFGVVGGLGFPNANQLGGNLPALTDQMKNNLFDAAKNKMGSNAYATIGNSRSDAQLQYVQIDEDGDGLDSFGKPMEKAGPNPMEGMSQNERTDYISNLFGQDFSRGVSGAGVSPFGSGQARKEGLGSALTGLGSIANYMNEGGEVNGPGTGTSDSVPARLSDGEFVLTAQAVRGAGGGDRDLGAARMYDMMSELERVA